MKLPKQAQPVIRNRDANAKVKTDSKGIHPSGKKEGIKYLIKGLLEWW